MSIPSSKYFTVGNGNKQLSWNQFSSFFPFYVFLPTTAKLITQKHCFLHFSALLEYLQHASPKCLHQSFWSYLAKLFLRASNFSHIVLISVLQIRLPTSHSLMFPLGIPSCFLFYLPRSYFSSKILLTVHFLQTLLSIVPPWYLTSLLTHTDHYLLMYIILIFPSRQ